MKKLLLSSTALAFAVNGFGAVTEKDFYSRLPLTSGLVLKLKGPLSLPPRVTRVEVIKHVPDADSDGVWDGEDWCEATPTAQKVWTAQHFYDSKCKQVEVGCSGKPGERWIHNPSKPEVAPSGTQLHCHFFAQPSEADRFIDANMKFTVASATSLTPDVKAFFEDYREGILLESPKGNFVNLRCNNFKWHQRLLARTIYVSDFSTSPASIAELAPYFDVTIAPPVPFQ